MGIRDSAVAAEAAASGHDICRRQTEGARADMADDAVFILQAVDVQLQHGIGGFDQAAAVIQQAAENQSGTRGAQSVSYTHLDVYKRQDNSSSRVLLLLQTQITLQPYSIATAFKIGSDRSRSKITAISDTL